MKRITTFVIALGLLMGAFPAAVLAEDHDKQQLQYQMTQAPEPSRESREGQVGTFSHEGLTPVVVELQLIRPGQGS